MDPLAVSDLSYRIYHNSTGAAWLFLACRAENNDVKFTSNTTDSVWLYPISSEPVTYTLAGTDNVMQADNDPGRVTYSGHPSVRSQSATWLWGVRQEGDGNNRVEVRADGAIRMGPGGTTTPDTEVRRIAADTVGLASGDSLDLKTNGNALYLEVASSAPAASSSMNGRLLIVDTGTARDLYYYANGQRFKLTGV